MSIKTVYGSVLVTREYSLPNLKYGIIKLNRMAELFNYAPGAAFCIDPANPSIRIFPSDDDRLIDGHVYLFVTHSTCSLFLDTILITNATAGVLLQIVIANGTLRIRFP